MNIGNAKINEIGKIKQARRVKAPESQSNQLLKSSRFSDFRSKFLIILFLEGLMTVH